MSGKINLKSPKLLFFTLSLVVIFEAYLLVQMNQKTPQNLSQEEKVWSDKIKELGAEAAYKYFKEQTEKLSPGQQHKQAHIFGQTLYKELGTSGISICDGSYAFGCYHAFLGTAINSEGLQVVPLLNGGCIDKLRSQALGCQHGIGHGILTDMGYDFKNLVEALNVCDSLTVKDPIGGCIGGVFMEYNFQTMLAENGRIRQLNDNNPYYPCRDIEEKYQPACYFWQGQWWGNILSGNYEQRYSHIGQLCDGIKESEEQKQCFIGSGNTVGQFVNWNADEAIKLCNKIQSYEGQLGCRAGAAGSFMAEPKAKEDAFKICEGFLEQDKQDCLKLARLSISGNQ